VLALPRRAWAQLCAGWHRLCAGPALVRGAGYGFAAVVLIQGTLLIERNASSWPSDGGLPFEIADPESAEPAAGPEPSEDGVQAAAGGAPAAAPPGHPPGCDPRLLRAIEERSRQLDAWSSERADRARMLEVIEARAAEQVRALEAQRRALEATLGNVEQAAEAEVARLVKIYENMKPKEAARIFEAMPAEVAAGFLRRMAEGKSALVMGRIEAAHAYAITLAIANNPELPATP
jgi:flagellar motility protein MotE (MotC chaperone)